MTGPGTSQLAALAALARLNDVDEEQRRPEYCAAARAEGFAGCLALDDADPYGHSVEAVTHLHRTLPEHGTSDMPWTRVRH